jgi:polyhydroxyalkanoate synthase
VTPLPLSELFEQWQWQLDGWWLRQSERQPWIRLLSQHLNQ